MPSAHKNHLIPLLLAISLAVSGMGPLPCGAAANTPPPPALRGLLLSADDPLRLDFIIDTGSPDARPARFRREADRLIKYFLAALTFPEDAQWVNLTPGQPDRVVPPDFGLTGMGQDMLAQDYQLKQFSAAQLSPGHALGRVFWDRVYQATADRLGTTQLPITAFHRVWVVPDQARVFHDGNAVYILSSHLRVMTDQDYQREKDRPSPADAERPAADIQAAAFQDLILPMIEREVNTGPAFAPLRQIFQAVILATWYKRNLRQGLLTQVYSDQRKVPGIIGPDQPGVQQIYAQYLTALRQGANQTIQESRDPVSGQIIPRKYVSGGIRARLTGPLGQTADRAALAAASSPTGRLVRVVNQLQPAIPPANQPRPQDQQSVPASSPTGLDGLRAVDLERLVSEFGRDIIPLLNDLDRLIAPTRQWNDRALPLPTVVNSIYQHFIDHYAQAREQINKTFPADIQRFYFPELSGRLHDLRADLRDQILVVQKRQAQLQEEPTNHDTLQKTVKIIRSLDVDLQLLRGTATRLNSDLRRGLKEKIRKGPNIQAAIIAAEYIRETHLDLSMIIRLLEKIQALPVGIARISRIKTLHSLLFQIHARNENFSHSPAWQLPDLETLQQEVFRLRDRVKQLSQKIDSAEQLDYRQRLKPHHSQRPPRELSPLLSAAYQVRRELLLGKLAIERILYSNEAAADRSRDTVSSPIARQPLEKQVGGIDFDPAGLAIDETGPGGRPASTPVAADGDMVLPGLTPHIVGLAPISDLQHLLLTP